MQTMKPEEHKNHVEEFYVKNDRLKRPISPHLTIYKPQMTSMLSITHRGTGLAQSGLMYGFALGVAVSSRNSTRPKVDVNNTLSLFQVIPGTFPMFMDSLVITHPHIITTAKFVIAWPFAFHLCNGLRHLVSRDKKTVLRNQRPLY